MNAKVEAAAELFRQLAFISALLGGFSLGFLVQLLATNPERRIASWTIGFSIAASAGLIVCVLGWTLSAATILGSMTEPEMAQLSTRLTLLHRRLSLAFIGSLLLFLVSLGLCGWIRSRVMGIVSSAIALIAAVAALLILASFVS
jgi:hypothetical protein